MTIAFMLGLIVGMPCGIIGFFLLVGLDQQPKNSLPPFRRVTD
jgi:hypothetical protein